MISYTSAIRETVDICILISSIYGIPYDQVCEDLQEALGLLEDNE